MADTRNISASHDLTSSNITSHTSRNTETECELLSSAACYHKHPAYTELDDGSIRLLRIKKGDLSNKIHCDIQIFSLDERPHYVALSYAWGSQRREHEIILDGLPLLVPKNLLRFLQSSRKSKDLDSCLLWIDMLSIDQANLSERAKQVVLMPKIFEKAASVRSWLGPAYAGSDTGMSALSKSSKLLHNRASLLQLLAGPSGSAIRELCTRAYWRRLWVLQELRLGRNKRLMCGSKSISWASFEKFMRTVIECSDDATEAIRRSPAMRMVNLSQQSQDATLWELIQTTSDLRCSDPRDRVFAILGITTTGHEDIEPDYTLPVPTLLNLVLNRHWKLTRPESLLQVAEHCKLAEDIFGLRRDEAYSLDGQRGKGVPTTEAERRTYCLRPKDSPISLWWALFYGHTSVEQLLWSSCRYSFFESDGLPNSIKTPDFTLGTDVSFRSLTRNLSFGTDPKDCRLAFFIAVISSRDSSIAHMLLNGWDSLDDADEDTPDYKRVAKAVDRSRVHLLETMFAPRGFFNDIQRRLKTDALARYLPNIGYRLPSWPSAYVRPHLDPDSYPRHFWHELIRAHSMLSVEEIDSEAGDIGPALQFAKLKGYGNIAKLLRVGRKHRASSEERAAIAFDAQISPVATMLWEDACNQMATFRENANLDLGREALQNDKAFTEEELDLIRLFILSQRVNINALDWHDRTPLMTAVVNDQPQLVKLLLECEACDVNKQTPSATASRTWRPMAKMTALIIAIKHQRADMVSLLLKSHHLGRHKVDVNLECESADGEPSLPLELAYRLNDDGAVAQLLLRTGECYWTRADLLQAAIEAEEQSNSSMYRRGMQTTYQDRNLRHPRRFKPGTGARGTVRRGAVKEDTMSTRAMMCLLLIFASYVIVAVIVALQSMGWWD